MLTVDSTLQNLLDEANNPDVCLRIREAAVGHGLPFEVPLHVVCSHPAFITRPSMILYINERTQAA